jgi:ubiquinone/menaquinone biosynthesis C-methylase UbiE
MELDYQRFDSFAIEYDFITNLEKKNSFFLNNLSDEKTAVLDIGCGSGILAFDLAQYYQNVVAIDICQEMLDIAQVKRFAPNIKYLLMDAENLVLDEKFDLITSANTFHHFQNLPAALQRIKELVKPGGKIVVLDNVAEVETPATIVYIFSAIQDFFPDWMKYGLATAYRLFKFRTSKPWLGHLATDRYLSAQQFKALYGSHFPNCSLTKVGCFMGMMWINE